MLQKDVGKKIGVCEETITLWENNKAHPGVQFYPKIIEFLGYFPFSIDTQKLGGKIIMYRYLNGLTQIALAKKLSINESTVHHYENDNHSPFGKIRKKLNALLSADEFTQLGKNDFKQRGGNYVENPSTIGEKLRNKRLEQLSSQKEVADAIGVTESTIGSWELNQSQPAIKYYPKIIEFLGYFPFEIHTTGVWGKLTYYRFLKGLTKGELAISLGANQANLRNWEKGIERPTTKMWLKVVDLLSSAGLSIDETYDFSLLKAYSKKPATIGEKLRNRRLEKFLTQKEVAKLLGIDFQTINSWELNRHLPPVTSYPKIIEFLGYFPWDIDTTDIFGKLKYYRYSKGLTKREFSKKELGVSISTLYRWEGGTLNPMDEIYKKLCSSLSKLGFQIQT